MHSYSHKLINKIKRLINFNNKLQSSKQNQFNKILLKEVYILYKYRETEELKSLVQSQFEAI